MLVTRISNTCQSRRRKRWNERGVILAPGDRSTDGTSNVRSSPGALPDPATSSGRGARTKRASPTSRDVAIRAGVSRTVVSFVLNDRPHSGIPEETRQRVMLAARELGYRPNRSARSLASGSTRTIGVFVGETRNDAYGDAFLPVLLRGIDLSARSMGYRIVLQHPEDRSSTNPYFEPFRDGSVDGVLICGPRENDRALVEIAESGAPVMVIGNPGPSGCASVDVDNADAAFAVTNHLIEHGYQRIALITNAPREFASARERASGFRRAMSKAGLDPDAFLLEGGMDEASGRLAMESLLRRAPRPEAVFAASDQVAFGVLAALQSASVRVPEEVALFGFDDLSLASHLQPPLSTVHVPATDLGRIAGQRLLDLVAGEKTEESRLILPTRLVLRLSCGRHIETGGS